MCERSIPQNAVSLSVMQDNFSVTSASDTNSSVSVGIYTVTAVAYFPGSTRSHTWIWNVHQEPPSITGWGNNKINNTDTTLTLNVSEAVNFKVSVDQPATYHWYKGSIDQIWNYDNFTTSWTSSSTRTVQANATNGNGTTSTITRNINIADTEPPVITVSSPVNGGTTYTASSMNLNNMGYMIDAFQNEDIDVILGILPPVCKLTASMRGVRWEK